MRPSGIKTKAMRVMTHHNTDKTLEAAASSLPTPQSPPKSLGPSPPPSGLSGGEVLPLEVRQVQECIRDTRQVVPKGDRGPDTDSVWLRVQVYAGQHGNGCGTPMESWGSGAMGSPGHLYSFKVDLLHDQGKADVRGMVSRWAWRWGRFWGHWR